MIILKIKKAIYIILMLTFVGMVLSGCVEVEKPSVASINGENITMDEYNYFLHTMQSSYEQSFESQGVDANTSWETEKDGKTTYEIMKETAYDDMMDIYILAAEAEKAGLSCDSSEINQTKSQMMQSFSSESAFLKEFDMNASGLNKVAKLMTLYAKYRNQLQGEEEFAVSDEDIVNEYKNTYMRAKHILFMTVDDSQQPLSDDEIAEKKKLAEEILAKAKSGADFDSLMNEYSEDPGSKTNPDGYVFTDGQMVSEFEEATKALKPGEISDIVETQFGYHIIKRLELNADTSSEEFQSIAQNLASTIFNNKLYDKIDEWKKNYDIKENTSVIEAIKRK